MLNLAEGIVHNSTIWGLGLYYLTAENQSYLFSLIIKKLLQFLPIF